MGSVGRGAASSMGVNPFSPAAQGAGSAQDAGQSFQGAAGSSGSAAVQPTASSKQCCWQFNKVNEC